MPTRWDLDDIPRRLDALLRELGYAREGEDGPIDRPRACRVVNRRTRRTMPEARFVALTQGAGAKMTAEEAVQLADGLGFDVRRLLYDEPPRRPDRPRSLLDEIDALGIPQP